ncbi:MAG: PilZ domain-containing protein [Bacillota bacterium]
MKVKSVEPLVKGTRVEIVLLRKGSSLEAWMPGRVNSPRGEEILVSLAADPSMLALFTAGAPVKVRYTGKRALYSFESVVTRQVQQGITLVGLEPPAEVSRVQRRGFVRLSISLPVKCKESCQGEVFEARTVDLSSGGMALVSRGRLSLGSMLEIWVDLDKYGLLPLKGEVRWMETLDLGDEGRYLAGITFVDTSEKTQDHITRFVFAEQARMRRLGLL